MFDLSLSEASPSTLPLRLPVKDAAWILCPNASTFASKLINVSSISTTVVPFTLTITSLALLPDASIIVAPLDWYTFPNASPKFPLTISESLPVP